MFLKEAAIARFDDVPAEAWAEYDLVEDSLVGGGSKLGKRANQWGKIVQLGPDGFAAVRGVDATLRFVVGGRDGQFQKDSAFVITFEGAEWCAPCGGEHGFKCRAVADWRRLL